ncbi:kinesin protein [Flagelloscypha sp. PMI_526]|nr:kinesin protein [Flagelloscypha sp. PMI_526]
MSFTPVRSSRPTTTPSKTSSDGRSTPSTGSRPTSLKTRTPLKTASSISSLSSVSGRSTPSTSSSSSLLGTTHKKYHAPLSVTTSRQKPKSNSQLSPIKASPNPSRSRSRSPLPPGSPSGHMRTRSEMDASVVDLETVLVDAHTVDVGDVSIDSSPSDLEDNEDDKVMVTIRVRPTESSQSAFIISPSNASLQLPSDDQPKKWNFGAVHGQGSSNKDLFGTSARKVVRRAMGGFNGVVFAYGQTASGKSHTMYGSGTNDEGIVGRSVKEVFRYIKEDTTREYLLRISYLEIYNESIVDLLAPPGEGNLVQIVGTGNDTILTPLREECITGLAGVKDVLKKGEKNRRTACTDWNDRSSRSHCVFRLVIESRERGSGSSYSDDEDDMDDLATKSSTSARSRPQTPASNRPQTPADAAFFSLIDLAGSEKATSSAERTREGKYINTSLLTLSQCISTLASNAQKGRTEHVPYRNSKLTRLLWGSLSGNALISVICTLNPSPSHLPESLSTLGFAKRVGGVKLHAERKEIISTDALIERYKKEIEELKGRLEEKEVMLGLNGNPVTPKGRRSVSASGGAGRRLSAREKLDSTNAMTSLNARIQQLTKLILTSESQSLDPSSSPSSPDKESFSGLWDLEPYQLQQELLAARMELERRGARVTELETIIHSSPPGVSLPSDDSSKTLVDDGEGGKYTLVPVSKLETLEQAAKDSAALRVEFEAKLGEYNAKWVEKEKKWGEKERELRGLIGSAGTVTEEDKGRIAFLEEELLSRDGEIQRRDRDIEGLEAKLRAVESSEGNVEALQTRLVATEAEWREKETRVHELKKKLDEERKRREEKEGWSKELERELAKEKKARGILENERRALAAFVTKFDSLNMLDGLAATAQPLESKLPAPALLASTGPSARRSSHGNPNRPRTSSYYSALSSHLEDDENASPLKLPKAASMSTSLLDEKSILVGEESFEDLGSTVGAEDLFGSKEGEKKSWMGKVLGRKNVFP